MDLNNQAIDENLACSDLFNNGQYNEFNSSSVLSPRSSASLSYTSSSKDDKKEYKDNISLNTTPPTLDQADIYSLEGHPS